MKPLTLGQVAARGVLLLFLSWLYGGDLMRWVQAQSAEVAALNELPHLWLALLGVAGALGGAVVLGMALAQKRPARWPPLRLLTIGALSLLCFDFVVLSSRKSMLSAEQQSQLAVQAVAEAANLVAGSEAVPRDPALLRSFLEGLGAVPYFRQGERVPEWKLELRERCPGPAAAPGPATAGTLIYCVATDRKQAWVTAVGTPFGQVFGPPAIVSTASGWVGEVHVAPPEPQAPDEPADAPVWDAPTPDDAP